LPFDGQHFVLLKSDDREVLANFSQISQRIVVLPGQRITGVYFFSTGDYMPYNDTAMIKLIPDPCSNPNFAEIMLAHRSVEEVGSFQTMQGWEVFTHDFNDGDAGEYTLILRVEDMFDRIYTSRLAVDAVKLCYLPPGDINGDCMVNFYDFAFLANQWLNDCNETHCDKADINQSFKVDFGDLMILATNWLINCDATPNEQACLPPRPE
jgi:hypothetical protein